MGSVRTLDTSNLTIAASGSSIVIPSTCRIRCALDLTGPAHRRSIKVHLVNDCARPLRVIPGTRTGVEAQLLSGLELTCAPYDEISFEYHVPIFSSRLKRAFALVQAECDTFGFLGPEIDDVMLPLLAGGLVVAAAAGCAAFVLAKRARRSEFRFTPAKATAASREPHVADPADIDEPDEIEEFVGFDEPDDSDRTDEPEARPIDASAIQERRAAAVAPVTVPSPISRQYTAVSFGDDAVVGTIECVDRKPLNLLFVAKVANQADEPLMCSIVGETRHGKQILFPDYFWVQPQSAAAVGINTPARYPWKLDRLVLRMQNSALACTAETIVPVPLAIRAMRVAAVFVSILVLAVVALSWYTKPRIEAFAAPQTIAAGSVANVSYATDGWGSTAYYVSNDGGTVQRGQLPMGRHEIHIRTRKRPQVYRILLTVDGFAGGTSVEQEIRTLPPQRVARAGERTSIDALEVNPPVATAGSPFDVRYVLNGRNASAFGTVSILDSVGIPLGSGPVNGSGVTSLVAPDVAAPTMFRVALDVSQNGERSQAATGLLVMPKGDSGKNTVAQDDLTPDQLFRISPRNPHSSEILIVRPLRYPSSISVTLQNDRGVPVDRKDIASAGGVARFQLPVVASDRKMTVVASYTLNRAQHVAIKSIVVHPALEASLESPDTAKARKHGASLASGERIKH